MSGCFVGAQAVKVTTRTELPQLQVHASQVSNLKCPPYMCNHISEFSTTSEANTTWTQPHRPHRLRQQISLPHLRLPAMQHHPHHRRLAKVLRMALQSPRRRGNWDGEARTLSR